jgi:hypothetical protein
VLFASTDNDNDVSFCSEIPTVALAGFTDTQEELLVAFHEIFELTFREYELASLDGEKELLLIVREGTNAVCLTVRDADTLYVVLFTKTTALLLTALFAVLFPTLTVTVPFPESLVLDRTTQDWSEEMVHAPVVLTFSDIDSAV